MYQVEIKTSLFFSALLLQMKNNDYVNNTRKK